MTKAEVLAEYANAVSGSFKNQLTRLIKALTMRTFVTDLSAGVVWQEDLGLEVTKDAVASKNITVGGTYVHAGAGATYNLADGISRLYLANDSASTGDVVVMNEAETDIIWTVGPGNVSYAFWDGDKYQWK